MQKFSSPQTTSAACPPSVELHYSDRALTTASQLSTSPQTLSQTLHQAIQSNSNGAVISTKFSEEFQSSLGICRAMNGNVKKQNDSTVTMLIYTVYCATVLV